MKRSSFAGTYTSISLPGGATLSTATGDNAFQDLIAIGFPFTYLGNTYSTIGASTNGTVAFTGISAGANNMNLYTAAGPNTVLAPWWDDLNVQNGTGSILYQLQGTPGAQTFTIQWTDVHSYASGSTALLNFQVVLFEQNNKIEFHYGAAPAGTFNTAESASIGIKSAVGGNGEFIDAVTGSSFTGNGMLNASTMWPARFFRFMPGTPAALAPGIYTVGMTGDYYNLSEAVAEINHRGVTGNGLVTFSLIDTLFDATAAHGGNFFPVLIGPVEGVSSSGSITFETTSLVTTICSPGVTAGNCVTQNSATAIGLSNEPVIGITGADFISFGTVTFGTLALKSSSPATDRGLLVINSSLTDGTRNCGFQNLNITLDRSNTNSIGVEQTGTAPLAASAGSNSFNIFQVIRIKNAYAGIQINGDVAFPDSNTTVAGCVLGDGPDDIGNGVLSTYAFHATNQSFLVVRDNIFRYITVNANVACTGIWLESMRGSCNVYGNKVRSIHNNSTTATANVTGISATIPASGTHQLYIFNNFVSDLVSSYTGAGSATVQVRGIHVQPLGGGAASSTINVDFNNIYMTPANSSLISNTCFETGIASGPVINTRNNIFVNATAAQSSPAGHFCIVSPASTTIGNSGSVSDHNDFFVVNAGRGFIAKGNTTTYTTLASWQAATTFDAQSLNIDPEYAGATDLHVLNTDLNAMGMALIWVPMDIDNQVRDVVPDIGADETYPADASPVVLLGPEAGNCYTSTEPVVVRVLNAGDIFLDFTQDTVPVTVAITGAITQTLTVVLDDNILNNGDPLPPGGYVDVSLGTINMTPTGTYIFNVHTSLRDDGNPYNDTLPTVTIVNAAPQVTITGNTLICASAATTLTANASGGDGNYSYQWSYGLGTNSSIIVNPAHDSTFYVSITDGCGRFTNDSIFIQTLPEPVADFTYSVTNNTATFTDNSQNTTTWSWDFGDTQNSTQQNPVHTYAGNGTYTVVLTATNNCGTATDTAIIMILTTGLDPFAANGAFTVFPNPVNTGSLTVFLPSAENNVVIEIEDMNGKLLRKKEFGNTMEGMSFVTDVSGFENGIYLLRVSSDRLSAMQKVVIEK